VLVTHDVEEAMLLSGELVVLDEGRVLQAGARAEVLDAPASRQVTRLLARASHPATVVSLARGGEGDRVTVRLAAGAELSAAVPAGVRLEVGQPCRVSLDPDAVRISPASDAPAG